MFFHRSKNISNICPKNYFVNNLVSSTDLYVLRSMKSIFFFIVKPLLHNKHKNRHASVPKHCKIKKCPYYVKYVCIT